MKTKTLLLAGLSALMLASCGMKSYKNEVSEEKFTEKLNEALSKNKIASAEGYFSFKFEFEKESKSVDKYYKNGKKLCKEVWESETEITIKFDSSKSICKIETEGESSHENECSSYEEEVDSEIVYQCDTQYSYEINVDEKLYEKEERINPSDYVAAQAFAVPKEQVSSFFGKIILGDKFYIDDNVFTIEEIFDEEDESKTKVGKTVYQLIIEDDKIKYYEEFDLEINEVNLKSKDEESVSWSIEKDDVSLKRIDLEKYLKIN